MRAWIATWNTNRRPFTWTNTVDEILNSLAKLRQATSLNEQN